MSRDFIHTVASIKLRVLDWAQDALYLIVRGHWGYAFAQAGYGKLTHLETPIAFFTKLGIPAPKVNAIMAGSAECFGGALLALGLCARPAGFVLSFVMAVAYYTADHEALVNVFKDPDKFTEATPFLFLLTALLVLTHGPGMLSLDALLVRLLRDRVSPTFLALWVGRGTAERILGRTTEQAQAGR